MFALTPHDIQVFSYVGALGYGDDDGNNVSTLLVDGATGRPWPVATTPPTRPCGSCRR